MGILQKTDTIDRPATKKRFLSILFLALFSVTVITQVFAPTVSAAIDPNRDPIKYAQAATLYNSLVMCVKNYTPTSIGGGTWWLRNGLGDFFNNDNAASGNWWNDGTSAASPWTSASFIDTAGISIPHTAKDGRVHCNDTVKAGVKAWEFAGPLDLLCSAGITRDGGGSCENGSTEHGFKLKTGDSSKLATAIKNKAFGGNEPQLTGAHNYLLYYTAFTARSGCAATAADTGTGDRNYTGVKIVQEDGTVKSTRFEAKPKSTKIYVYATAGSEVRQSCEQIANAVSQYAQPYADMVEQYGLEVEPIGGDGEFAEANTCGVDSGWFICPIVETTAKITDGLYDSIISQFVRVPPISTDTSTDNGMYQGWKSFRNIANVAFIIAFMVIIYSQVTSAGISNYGIKKLLPRLIIAALLVNVSYWISAIAVDLSNIAGASISEFLGSIDAQMSIQNVPTWTDLTTLILSLGAVAAGIAGIALAPELGLSLIGLVAPLMIGALLAILAAVVVLILRQAAIIILVILSPLAFVAMLLPNTEKWFTKWRQWFLSFLLLYPAVAVLFGGAQIAGQVLANAQTSGIATLLAYASALFVTAAPLFLIPFMIRQYGGNGIDKLGAKIQSRAAGLGKKASAPLDNMRKNNMKRVGSNLRRRSFERATDKEGNELDRFKRTGGVGRFIRYSERRKAEQEGIESESARASKNYVTDTLKDDESFRERVSGTGRMDDNDSTAIASRNRVLARALTEQDRAEDEEVANAAIIRLSEQWDGDQRLALAMKGRTYEYKLNDDGSVATDANGKKIQDMSKEIVVDNAGRKDAIDSVFKQGSYGDVMKVVEESGGELNDFNSRIASHYAAYTSKNSAIGGGTIDAVSTGRISNKKDMQESVVKMGINGNRFEAKDFASVGASALEYNYNAIKAMQDFGKKDGKIVDNSEHAIANRAAGDKAMEKFKDAALGAVSSRELVSSFDGSDARKEVVTKMFGVKNFDEIRANPQSFKRQEIAKPADETTLFIQRSTETGSASAAIGNDSNSGSSTPRPANPGSTNATANQSLTPGAARQASSATPASSQQPANPAPAGSRQPLVQPNPAFSSAPAPATATAPQQSSAPAAPAQAPAQPAAQAPAQAPAQPAAPSQAPAAPSLITNPGQARAEGINIPWGSQSSSGQPPASSRDVWPDSTYRGSDGVNPIINPSADDEQ